MTLWLASEVVVAGRGDELTCGDVAIPTSGRRATAIVGGELWVIDRDGWSRWSLRGERIGQPVAHPALAGDGQLVPCGPRATWNGPSSAVLTPEGAVETLPRADLTLAIDRTTMLACANNAIRLRERGVEAWHESVKGRVVAGAVLFGGRRVAIVAGDALLVLDPRDGSVHHKIRVVDMTSVAFASAGGRAAIGVGDRRVLLLDLRFGAKLREYAADAPIDAFAIDDAGQQLAIRVGDDVRMVSPTDDDPAWHDAEATAAEPEPAPEPVEEWVEAIAPVAEPVVEPLDVTTPLAALRPVATVARATPDEAAEVMRRHVALIGSLVERAVAEAWDVGRLAPAGAGAFIFAAELDGILGLVDGNAPERVHGAEQRMHKAQTSLLEVVRAIDPRLAPLTELALEFGLTPLDADVLMVVAAPVLVGELARAYAILANDTGRPLCDELLVCQILAPRAARRNIARTLDRDRPLRHYGLITATGHRPFESLRPDPLVIRRLRALPLDADIEPNVRLVPASRALANVIVPRAVLDAAIAALAQPAERVRIVMRGRLGSGRRTLLAALAERAGRRLAVIDGSYYAHDAAQRATYLELALGRAHLRGWLPCVENLDDLGDNDRAARQRVVDVLRAHPGPVAVRIAHDAPIPFEPGYIDVELPTLDERDRTTAWTESIARHELSVAAPEALAARFRFGPGTIERVCAAAPKHADARALDNGARQHLSGQLGDTAQQIRRLATWADVVLPPDVMDSVLELTARIRHRRRVFEEWGYDQRITSSRGVTALFQGGPGTGKTLVASAIARELGLDLYRVDLARITSKWIGETERNLANLFDAAEDGQAIILFDEADSLFAKRTEVRTSVDRYANLEVNYLLQRMDTFEGIALLTTNFGGAIDRAFQRRLTLRLTFPFPDEDMREQLWRAHIPDRVPRRGAFDLGALARKYRLSGGYIRNACLRAAFLAAEEGGALTFHHLERAVALEFREVGKLGEGGVLE